MELPTLESELLNRANQKLENDIADLNELLYNAAQDPALDRWYQLLNESTITIIGNKGKDNEFNQNVKLITFFDNAIVKNAIREKRLPEYVQAEIDLIIKKVTE